MGDRNKPRNRRRGVRASRIKLHRSLAEKGLKTQAALAERIAELEGLDAAPTDIVNKVFREQAVDPQTLERVARALGTPSYKLYLTSEDAVAGGAGLLPAPPVPGAAPEPAPQPPGIEPVPQGVSSSLPALPHEPPPVWRRPWLIATGGAALLVAAVAVVVLQAGRLPFTLHSIIRVLPTLRASHVVVTAFKGDADGRIGTAVIGQLRSRLSINSPALQQVLEDESAGEISRRMSADAVVSGEIVTVGQLAAVRVQMFRAANASREEVWTESFPAAALRQHVEAIARHVRHAVAHALELEPDTRSSHFAPARAQDDYLQGRQFLDRVHSELNMRRAQGHFEAAIREDPDYGAAYASLCAATLEAWWIDDEQRQIEDAQKSCDRALRLDPAGSDTLRARAELARKTGHAAEGVALATQAIAGEPADMDATLTLAANEFDLFRQTGDASWGALSLRHATQATKLVPTLAKPWQSLATYQFYVASVAEAVPTFEHAHGLDPANDYVTSNLGTMYLCLGSVEKARDLYLQVDSTAASSYLGDEFLGGVYYYLHDYAESARLRQLGVDGAAAGGGGGIHQIWGGLGDSYRRAGQTQKAVAAYRKALEIVERDFLVGDGGISDKAYRAYYSRILEGLVGRRIPAAAQESLDRDLKEVFAGSTDPSGLLKVAQTWLLEGDAADARLALDKASRRCPGLARHPDVETLNTGHQHST